MKQHRENSHRTTLLFPRKVVSMKNLAKTSQCLDKMSSYRKIIENQVSLVRKREIIAIGEKVKHYQEEKNLYQNEKSNNNSWIKMNNCIRRKCNNTNKTKSNNTSRTISNNTSRTKLNLTNANDLDLATNSKD